MSEAIHTYLYLSPHLDDAVLSCGGTIRLQVRRGARVLVATLFAGSPTNVDLTPFTRELWERWGRADDPVAARRDEDRVALSVLGAEALHLPYLDCVYRQAPDTGEALYPTVEHIFAALHPAEERLDEELAADLRARVPLGPGVALCAPLAAGHHVDHQIVRRMALRLRGEVAPLACFEDWPYAGDEETVARALDDEVAGWRRRVAPIDEDALAAKGDAVACYASQISTFWPDADAMRAALRAQALRVGGDRPAEAFWQPVSVSSQRGRS